MKTYRVIYSIEGITDDGELAYRLYAANKRTAERLARKQRTAPTMLRKLSKGEHAYIDPAWVERL